MRPLSWTPTFAARMSPPVTLRLSRQFMSRPSASLSLNDVASASRKKALRGSAARRPRPSATTPDVTLAACAARPSLTVASSVAS